MCPHQAIIIKKLQSFDGNEQLKSHFSLAPIQPLQLVCRISDGLKTIELLHLSKPIALQLGRCPCHEVLSVISLTIQGIKESYFMMNSLSSVSNMLGVRKSDITFTYAGESVCEQATNTKCYRQK